MCFYSQTNFPILPGESGTGNNPVWVIMQPELAEELSYTHSGYPSQMVSP
jgi:hypothetical protein